VVVAGRVGRGVGREKHRDGDTKIALYFESTEK
jgi:hypothetical protein